jgi:hypothetical protein
MAKRIRRVIRKIQPAYAMALDEQLWPINVTLLVLGGFATGVLLALGNPTTDVLWLNAWMWIAMTWTAILTGTWVAWQYGGLMARRTQLSLVIALIIFVALLVSFRCYVIFAEIAMPETLRDVVQQPEHPVPNEFQVQDIRQETPQLDIQRPVEEQEVEPEPDEPEQIPREQPQEEPEPEQPQPQEQLEPEPQVAQETRPNPIQRPQETSTPVRRANDPSMLSRQPQQMQTRPTQVATLTPAREAEPQRSNPIEAPTKAIAQRPTQSSTQQPTPRETAETQTTNTQVQSAQRQTATAAQPQQSAARPQVARAIRQPTQVPRVEAVAVQQSTTANPETTPTRPEPTSVVQRQQVETPVNPQQQPTTEPQQQPTPQPPSRQLVRQPTPDQPVTQPRQNQPPTRVARQVQPAPATQVAVTAPPTPQPTLAAASSQVAATTGDVSRQTNQTAEQRPSPAATAQADPTETTVPQPAAQPASRQVATSAPQPQTSSAPPTPQREIRQPTQIASSAPAVAEQASTTEAVASGPSASAPTGSVQRNVAASPEVASQPAQTTVAETTAQPETGQSRATPSPQAETLARSSMTSPSRVIQSVAAPTTSVAVPTQVASSESPSSTPTLQPEQTSVARRQVATTSAPQAGATAASQSASDVPTPSTAVASRPRAAAVANQPTASSEDASSQPSRHTNNVAQVAVSPVPLASPANVESTEANPFATQPRTAALSRSQRGTAGAGQQRNLDRGEPGPRTVSDIASASARRAEATSQQPDPRALATSSQARVAKGRAMADIPSSTLRVQPVDVAVAAGVEAPSDLEATASAAQRNASAAATQGTVTADAGSTDVDTGPTQMASEFSSGRAAGGGEPELHLATQTTRASRLATPGGAQLAAINTQVVAAEAADVPADSGGQPQASPAETQVASVSRATTTDAQPQAQPALAATATAAADIAGGAPQVAAARVPRATAAVAFPGASAGGGTASPVRQPATNFTANTKATVPALETAVAGEGNTQPENIQVAVGPVTRQQPRAGASQAAVPQPTATAAGTAGAVAPSVASQVATAAPARAAGTSQPQVAATTQAAQPSRTPRGAGPQLAAANTQVATPDGATGATAVASATGGAEVPSPESVAVAVTRSAASATATGQPSPPSTVDAPVEGEVAVTSSGVASPAASPGQSASGAPSATATASAATGPVRNIRPAAAAVAATNQISVPTVEAGAIAGKGEPAEIEVEAAQVARADGELGIEGIPANEPTGAAAGEVTIDADSLASTGAQAGPRPEVDSGGQPGPAAATASSGGAPFKVARAAVVPGISKIALLETDVAAGGPEVAVSEEPPMQFGGGDGSLSRRDTGGIQSAVTAQLGDGGIGAEPAPEAGSTSRKAQLHSEVLALASDARFEHRDIGGPQFSGNTKARDTGSAFKGRKREFGIDGRLGSVPNVGPEIVSGLEFLRRHQAADGSWSFNNLGSGQPAYENETAQYHADTAATGMCLMCFFGAGYDHFDFGGEYTGEIQSALKWLSDHQQEDGNLYVDQDSFSSKAGALYSHAIATMALCEAYGMTRDPQLRPVAQKAIEFIEKSQHPERGGWRYEPGVSSDLSVTGWMIGALKSGELAGLEVQKKTYENAFAFLERCTAPRSNGSQYVYDPQADAKQRQQRQASRPMTAVGLLLRLYEGWDRTRPEMTKGADYLAEQLPDYGSYEVQNTYYWYYATQVMFHMRGQYWADWKNRLHTLLRSNQLDRGPFAGSWDPEGDRWGSAGGRVYVTAMNLLSLEVEYRYLPLYQETDK